MPIKIACIGCSYTEGLQSQPIESSYPYILYEKLKEKVQQEIIVYNCAIGGSSSKVHKNIFEYVKTSIKPDIIINQITDHYRCDILNHNQPDVRHWGIDLTESFYLTNSKEESNYYSLNFDTKQWSILPILAGVGVDSIGSEMPWTAINPFAKGEHNPNPNPTKREFGTVKNMWANFIKPNSTLTYQQFKNYCLYKYHVERYSHSVFLDWVSDIDHVLNLSGDETLSFFWLERDKRMYNDYKETHKQHHFNGTDIESVFKAKKKKLNDYSHDNHQHLNTKGHKIVVDWIINKLVLKGKIQL